jgi:hypothetical protein
MNNGLESKVPIYKGEALQRNRTKFRSGATFNYQLATPVFIASISNAVISTNGDRLSCSFRHRRIDLIHDSLKATDSRNLGSRLRSRRLA